MLEISHAWKNSLNLIALFINFFVPRNIELNVETHSSSCIEGVLEF